MKKLLFLLILNFCISESFAQDFSNKGKDFWLGYGYHVNMGGGVAANQLNLQDLVLYLTSDMNATVTVSIPSVGYSQVYTVTANQVTTTLALPKSGTQDCRIKDTGYFNTGIHVTSTSPIVAYAHLYNQSVSGASLLFPTNTLGQSYYSIAFTQNSNASQSNNFFFVVATEDSTTVEITPSAANKNGKPVGVPFNVQLNKGQIYSVFGTTTGNTGTDLTGSRIRSVNIGAGACKRIAVFSGSGKMSIGVSTPGGTGTASGSADNLFAQALPANAWGRKYLTSPTGSQPNNFFRVCVSDPTTVVKLNGTIIPSTSLINGFYYQFRNTSASNTTSASGPNLIEADKAILVSQYCTTQGLEGNPGTNNTSSMPGGDPEMIYLSPVEQTINNITLFSAKSNNILQSYINVIIKNGGVSSFKLDGASMVSSFVPHPREANYSYATFSVASNVSHSLYSDTGFNAIAYGFGSAESYGYNAGTNVIDLYQYVTLQNQYASVNFPLTCKGTPFSFSITLPYQPVKIKWNFNQNPNLIPSDSVVLLPAAGQTFVQADSSFVKDGKTLYVFKLTQSYVFNASGTYPIKVFASNPTTDGCSGEQEINYDIQVFDKPISDFTYTHNGCLSDSLKFLDATNGLGRPTVKWKWEFGDATIDSVKNPVKKYLTAGTGTYPVKLTSFSDIGCISDTTKNISISSDPVTKFGISDTTCAGKSILFTDSTTIAVGSIVKWYWDFGDGTKDTLTSMPLNYNHTYNTAGTYTVTLMTQSNTGCKSSLVPKTFVVRQNPVPNFSLPIVCLPTGTAQFNNLTTIADGTIANVTYVWNFGDGTPTTTISNPLHNYTSTGPFTVNLKAISQYGCIKDSSIVLSTIYPAPPATINVTAETCLRDSTNFSDVSTGMGVGNTITNWYWNRNVLGGTAYVDTLQSFNYRYGNAGTYTVKFYYKTDKGCLSDTATKIIVINPLPTASFINSNPLCEKNNAAFTTQSVPNVGNIVRWYWDMGNTIVNNFTNANVFNQTYSSWGNYIVKHIVETDKGCKSDTLSKTVYINPLPQVGFTIPEVCLADAAAVFTDTSKIADGTQSLFVYKWNFNLTGVIPGPTPATSTLKNGTTKYNKSDNYQVRLKVTSGTGCTDSLTTAFTVNGSIPKSDFDILNPTGLCSNTPVKIQNISTVDFGWLTKVEIYWDYLNNPTQKVVDDTPNVAEIYNHLYTDFQQPATKTYTIKFVAYSGGTCADVKIKTITVNASPKTQFLTLPGICFEASPRQITQASELGGVAGGSPAFAYYGTGVNNSGLFNPSISGVGTFPIKYVYSSNKGCQDSTTRNITVWPSPSANFGFSSPTCEKNPITITDSSLANFSNIVTWQYDFGDATTLVRNNVNPFTKTYTSGTLTNYNISLKVITDSGCVSPIKVIPIKVNYLPVVNFSLPDICLPDGRGTFNDLSTITDNSQALFSRLWNFGDPNDLTPSTLPNPVHQYSALAPTGGYPVKLIVTSKDGCVDSLTKMFDKVYPQPKADFTVLPSNNEICIGDTLFFTDKSDGKTSAVNQWNWAFGDNTSSTLQNPFRKYTDTGNFTVKLFIYNSQGCVSDTLPKIMTVHPYPKLDLGPDLFVLEGGSVLITPKSYYATNPIFLWTPNTYLNSDTLAVPRTTPLKDITYVAKLTGIGGCSITDSVFIKVLLAPTIPNVFSPNGDGIHDFWEIQYLESYPGATIEVFNRGGRLLYSSINYSKPWDGKFNGNPLPVGTYYYIINPKNGRNVISGSVTIIK